MDAKVKAQRGAIHTACLTGRMPELYDSDTHHETVGGAPQAKTEARKAKKAPGNNLRAASVPPGGLLSRVCVIH